MSYNLSLVFKYQLPLISRMKLLLLVALASTLFAQLAPSSNPTQLITRPYSLDTSLTYNSKGAEWENKALVINHNTTLLSSSIKALVFFRDLSVDFSNQKADAAIYILSANRTSIKVGIASAMPSAIERLGFTTFVVSGIFTDSSRIMMSALKLTPRRNVSSAQPYSVTVALPELRQAEQIAGLTCLNGFNLTAVGPLELMELRVVWERQGNWLQLTLTSFSPTPTYVQSARASWLLYQPSAAAAVGRLAVLPVALANLAQPNQYVLPEESQNSKHLIGLSGFALAQGAQLDFTFSSNPNNITLKTASSYHSFQYQVLSVDLSNCQSAACENLCPARHYYNASVYSCAPCLYECFSCNLDSRCLSCDAINDFRSLDVATRRCVPMLGYYDNGQQKAIKCPPGCRTCSSADLCLTCLSGYTLISKSHCQKSAESTLKYPAKSMPAQQSGISSKNYNSNSNSNSNSGSSSSSNGKSSSSSSSNGKSSSSSSSNGKSSSSSSSNKNTSMIGSASARSGSSNYSSISSSGTVKSLQGSDKSDCCTGLALKVGASVASCTLILILIVLLCKKCRARNAVGWRDHNQPSSEAAIQPAKPASAPGSRQSIADSLPNPTVVRIRPHCKIEGASIWTEMGADCFLPETECTIDLAERANLRLECGHCFHLGCIWAWRKRNESCPLCRKKIADEALLHCEGCLHRYRQVSLKAADRATAKAKEKTFRYCEQCL